MDLWNVGILPQHYAEDGGSMDLWNVGILPQPYAASQTTIIRLGSSPPWKPQILHFNSRSFACFAHASLIFYPACHVPFFRHNFLKIWNTDLFMKTLVKHVLCWKLTLVKKQWIIKAVIKMTNGVFNVTQGWKNFAISPLF